MNSNGLIFCVYHHNVADAELSHNPQWFVDITSTAKHYTKLQNNLLVVTENLLLGWFHSMWLGKCLGLNVVLYIFQLYDDEDNDLRKTSKLSYPNQYTGSGHRVVAHTLNAERQSKKWPLPVLKRQVWSDQRIYPGTIYRSRLRHSINCVISVGQQPL